MKQIEERLNQYIQYCRDVRKFSPATVQGKEWFVSEFVKGIGVEKLEDLSNDAINEWVMAQSRRGVRGVTINDRLEHLRVALRYLHACNYTTPKVNMALIVDVKEMPPRRKYWTQEQIDRVLSMAKPFEWLLISLTYDCGFRLSELRNLRLSNINGQRINFIGKGSKAREVYMSIETKRRLDAYIEFSGVTDYLWLGERPKGNRPITAEGIRQRMTRAFERAGYTGFYPHSLRHSFATNICSNGAPMPIVQQMLGHANIMTTERYVHTFEGRLKEYFNTYKFAIA